MIKQRSILLLLLLLLLLTSCPLKYQKSNVKNIFNVKIGYGENEIGFYKEKNIINVDKLNTFARSGFFYLSDAKNNKILKLTQNGIPVLIIYNPENNPHLIQTDDIDATDDSVDYLKIYKEYKIVSPGLITADVNKNIYFINRNPEHKKNESNGTVLDTLIVKLDNKGNYLYKIGQNGIDTLPFGRISQIITDNKNQLFVSENHSNGYRIYKFSSNGELLDKITLSNKDIPVTQREKDYLIDIINLNLSFFEDEIYINCQYVKETIKHFSIKTYETMYEKILKYSFKDKQITKSLIKMTPKYIDLSKLTLKEEIRQLYNNQKTIMKPLETFIGMDINRNMYFIQNNIPIDNLYNNSINLFIYDINGRLNKKMEINFPINTEFTSNFYLTDTGKIYTYYVKEGLIQFVTIKN